MATRIMRWHGEFCHRCFSEIKMGERWYRDDGVRRTEERKIYHANTEICYKNLNKSKGGIEMNQALAKAEGKVQ